MARTSYKQLEEEWLEARREKRDAEYKLSLAKIEIKELQADVENLRRVRELSDNIKRADEILPGDMVNGLLVVMVSVSDNYVWLRFTTPKEQSTKFLRHTLLLVESN